jgi:hypothetical protein
MPSSISPSSARTPRRALWLAGLALAALLASAAYTLWLNPEVRFYKHSTRVKRAWAEKMRGDHGAIVVVCGCSTTAFSVDGERMVRVHKLPVVNFGLHAGMEPPFLAALAAEATRPGDTLILELDPVLITAPFSSADVAAQLGLALGRPGVIHASNLTGEPVHWVEDLLSLRPGAYHCFTLLGKIALRKPLYRYQPRDVRPSGWQQTAERTTIVDESPPKGGLSPDARRLFQAIRNWGETNRVQVAYSLVWRYATPEHQRAYQRLNLAVVREVAEILPVLKDPVLGAYTLKEHFADVGAHLTEAGAAARSDALAAQIREHRFWTREELLATERELNAL